MDLFKHVVQKLLFPSAITTLLITIPSYLFVIIVLWQQEHSFYAYVAYMLSAYALLITATGVYRLIKGVWARKWQWYQHQWIWRLLKDAIYRSRLTLQLSLLVNLLYVVLNLYSGMRFDSPWFVSLAVYYLLLALMRAILTSYVQRYQLGVRLTSEYRYYRICGFILLFMNQALVGIVVYMVNDNRGFSYPGTLIYAMAAYTFYTTIASVVNLLRYKKYHSPVLSAAKMLSFTSAIVSVLALQTAMISQFGNGDEAFRYLMNSVTGGAVCIIVLLTAIYMIVRSNRELKHMKEVIVNGR